MVQVAGLVGRRDIVADRERSVGESRVGERPRSAPPGGSRRRREPIVRPCVALYQPDRRQAGIEAHHPVDAGELPPEVVERMVLHVDDDDPLDLVERMQALGRRCAVG
jgi:hypothetical protein